MRPLEAPHRNNLRAILELKMDAEGADAVLATLPASEAEMPATKDFVRAELNDLRADMIDRFSQVDSKMNERFAEQAQWLFRSALVITGLLLTAIGAAATILGIVLS